VRYNGARSQTAPRACDGLADPAQPEDADPSPAGTSRKGNLPPAIPHRTVVRDDPPLHRQHQPDRKVRDVVGQHVGRSRYRDAARLRSGKVDPVVAHAVDRDDLQRGQAIEQRRIDHAASATDDRARRRRRILAVQREALGERRFQHGRDSAQQIQIGVCGFVGHDRPIAALPPSPRARYRGP